MQRTRLRRAPTEAVSSQKTFARRVAGQTRRAADAIVRREEWGTILKTVSAIRCAFGGCLAGTYSFLWDHRAHVC